MKLWQKGKKLNKKVDYFTVGDDRIHDLKLAKYDCQASIAHALMLEKIGLLSNKELIKIVNVLSELKNQAEDETFMIETFVEHK